MDWSDVDYLCIIVMFLSKIRTLKQWFERKYSLTEIKRKTCISSTLFYSPVRHVQTMYLLK